MQVKIREYPEKFSDYMMENGQLYRNLGQKADEEDYFPRNCASLVQIMVLNLPAAP